MRVLLISYGSMGDVIPFVALAQALRRRSHQPVFALPRHLVRHVTRYGIDVVPIGPDLGEVFRMAHMQITEGRFSQQDADRGNQVMAEIGAQALQSLAPLAMSADLIVSLYGMPFVDVIHRSTGLPVVVVRVAYPGHESPVPDNAGASHMSAYSAGSFQPALHLYALSRAVFTPPPDFPPDHHVTGFFFLDDEPFTPPADLRTFLEQGPAPVVITMGSMMHADPARLTQIFVNAIERVGCRAVIQSGWSGLAQDMSLPHNVHVAEHVPHAWLFPRAACVVHHGGAGTTASALRSGVPTIVIPHGLDQFVMAGRVDALGCVCGIVPYRELTVDALSNALAKTLDNQQLQAAATAARTVVIGERGVAEACDRIEAIPLSKRSIQA